MDDKTRALAIEEAKERMELLGIDERDIAAFCSGELTKVVVDHGEKRFKKDELTDEEKKMIARIEKEQDIIVYYVIKDKGVWPDGAEFERYPLPSVDTYVNDYGFIKESCIKACGTLVAHVENMEDPRCSGREEFRFKVVKGIMINAS